MSSTFDDSSVSTSTNITSLVQSHEPSDVSTLASSYTNMAAAKETNVRKLRANSDLPPLIILNSYAVPFKWEESPGKPRLNIVSVSPSSYSYEYAYQEPLSPTSASLSSSLKLPPKLEFQVQYSPKCRRSSVAKKHKLLGIYKSMFLGCGKDNLRLYGDYNSSHTSSPSPEESLKDSIASAAWKFSTQERRCSEDRIPDRIWFQKRVAGESQQKHESNDAAHPSPLKLKQPNVNGLSDESHQLIPDSGESFLIGEAQNMVEQTSPASNGCRHHSRSYYDDEGSSSGQLVDSRKFGKSGGDDYDEREDSTVSVLDVPPSPWILALYPPQNAVNKGSILRSLLHNLKKKVLHKKKDPSVCSTDTNIWSPTLATYLHHQRQRNS